jgi:hypothetical protein
MHADRRSFLSSLGATLAVGAAANLVRADNALAAESSRDLALGCLDYGRSFIVNSASFNAVRFWVESRTVVYDDAAGTSHEFLQCGSCKSENTFGAKDLFFKDNYDFLPILGGDQWLIFRRPAGLSDRYRQLRTTAESWGPPELKLRRAGKVSLLETWEQVRDKSAAAIPIVSQTQLKHPDTGLRAMIECPVKTLNLSLDRRMYQVDTGPIAYPDLSRRHDPPLDGLQLAFIAFNAPHFADFVIEQPTGVSGENGQRCQVYHYSNPFSLPAENRLLAMEDHA